MIVFDKKNICKIIICQKIETEFFDIFIKFIIERDFILVFLYITFNSL